MIVVVARWQTTEAALPEVLAAVAELAPRSLSESGCVGYEVLHAVDEPTAIVLIERYRDAEAVAAHRNSPHYQELVVGRIVPLLTDRRVEVCQELTAR